MPITYAPDAQPTPEPPDEIRVRPQGWSRKTGLLLAAAGLLPLLGLAALMLAPPEAPQRLTMPDGSVFTLEAVTYGFERKVTGTPWQRLVRAVLPPAMKDASGARVFAGDTGGVLTFWTSQPVDPIGGTPGYEQIQAVPVDENDASGPPAQRQGLGSGVERFVCDTFPRRGKVVRLKFYQRVDQPAGGPTWTFLGELSTPNPEPGPHPVWTAPTLPVRANVGPVQLEFSELTEGVKPEGMYLSPSPLESYWRMAYRIREGGKMTDAWSAEIHSLRDATGTVWPIRSSGTSSTTPGAYVAHVTGPAGSKEAAIQASIYVWPTPSGRLAPQDLWTVRRIPLPARGRQERLDRGGQVHDVSLALDAVYGPKAKLPADIGFVIPDQWPRLALRLPPSMPDGWRGLVVRATDDRGRPVVVESSASTSNGTRALYLFTLKPEPGARSFDLTYAVVRRQEVEVVLPVGHATSGGG
jgi:hypothetical protein